MNSCETFADRGYQCAKCGLFFEDYAKRMYHQRVCRVNRNLPDRTLGEPSFVDLPFNSSFSNSNADNNNNNIVVQTHFVMPRVELFDDSLICEERRIPNPPSVFIRDSEAKELTWEYKYKQESYMRFLGYSEILNMGDGVDVENYVERMREKQFNVSALRMHKVLEFVNDNAISREETNNLLSLINYCGGSVPKDMGSLTRKVDSRSYPNILKYAEKEMPYRAEWGLRGRSGLVIRAFDCIEFMSYLFVDPVIAFGWGREHVHVNASRLRDEHSVEDADGGYFVGHLMSSDWANRTERGLRARTNDENSKLLVLIPFHDGVAMGQRRNAKVVTAQATCGNFSLQLSRKDRSKVVLGYIFHCLMMYQEFFYFVTCIK